LHLPRYPLYRPGEALVGDYDYFFLRGERYLSCQAARFLLLGGDFITLADEAAVDLTVDVSAYWSGYYREHFADRIGAVLRYTGPTGYRQNSPPVTDGRTPTNSPTSSTWTCPPPPMCCAS
jgi:hypothetical protein